MDAELVCPSAQGEAEGGEGELDDRAGAGLVGQGGVGGAGDADDGAAAAQDLERAGGDVAALGVEDDIDGDAREALDEVLAAIVDDDVGPPVRGRRRQCRPSRWWRRWRPDAWPAGWRPNRPRRRRRGPGRSAPVPRGRCRRAPARRSGRRPAGRQPRPVRPSPARGPGRRRPRRRPRPRCPSPRPRCSRTPGRRPRTR